ncbi:TPA: integrase arm-type DNA-binding domain-containing protein [Vibrio parahaemolyticus]|nr:integrase arm-type DNA-binding domain-containing protein [Vibrio parahaemolyticus]HCG5594794.1 integrase arm-type DNA-binding domain-containing protein [Vibrio parahaemolyticus]HCG6497944.1 integrase arm-type DNA-binding domain-containing protein [Vibrio parahaemolyticus]
MGKLYDKHLKSVVGKNHSEAFVLTDGHGLSARVSAKGKVRWQYRYKIDGKNKRMDLGDYPALSLVKARDAADQCRGWLAEGFDPKQKRSLEREEKLHPVTVIEALEYWLVEYAEENRANADKHRAQFERHIYPYIGKLPIEQAETRHWVECFDRIRKGISGKQRPAPVAAGYVLQNAKQALRFCRVRRYANSRVLDDLTISDVGNKQRKKDRVLSVQELVDVWRFTEGTNLLPYYVKLVRLLIIFGARSQEVRLSTWSEWDFNEMLWTVPKTNSKTGERIVRPIPEELKDWLVELKVGTNRKDFILGELKSSESVSQFGRMLWKRLEHTEGWTLHDLRRTFATCLNDLGVAPHVVEQLLGHSLGGVMAIYHRSQYLSEKRAALDMWVKNLDSQLNPDTNVVPIRNRAY